MKKRRIWIVLAILLAGLAIPLTVLAFPPLPYTTYGTVKLNGNNVSIGTVVTAHCGTVQSGYITTTLFNGESFYSMSIIGDDPDTPAKDGCSSNETVAFKIAGYTADQTGTWVSGKTEQVNLTASPKGILNVTKTVNWNGIPQDPGQSFQICISGASHPGGDCKNIGYTGGLLTWNNLLGGSYTVTETDPGSTWQVTGSGAVVIVPIDQTASTTIVNTRKLGTLQSSKSVVWNGVTADPTQTFTICIQGPTYGTPNCKNIGSSGGLLTWNNLIPGTYNVTENDPGIAWSVVITGSQTTVPIDGGLGASTVVNARKLGSLKVTKTVNWNGITPVSGQTFQICIQGPSYTTPNCKTFTDPNSLEQIWSNLVPGSYAVTETNPGNMWAVTLPGSPATVPVDGGQATASVSNTRKLGSLRITKSVNWNGIAPVSGQTFQICIQGPSYGTPNCKTFTYPNGLDQTWTGLLPGNYTVTENDPGNMWTVGLPASPVSVPVDGSQATATVNNTRKLGSLKITKSVNWNGITPVAGQTFQICILGPSYATPNCKTFTDPSGLDQTWTNLIPGDYTVTESDPGNQWTVVLPTLPVVVPADGAQATATVTNSRRLGSLKITKSVNWNGVTAVPGQSFQICIQGPSYATPNCQTFTDPFDLAKTWTNLIPGDYTVTETNPGTMWTASVPGSPIPVPVDGGQATATVTNTRKLGSLKITKSVNWNGIAAVPGQSFQICIQGPSYSTPNCQTYTYPGSLELTWNNLVPGSYTVTENDPGNMWAVSTPGAPVVVPVDGSQATATVSNTRKLSSLQITKSVNWNGITPVSGQTFQICIQGPSYATPDCKTFTSPGSLIQTWANLIPGNYTVTETDPGNMWNATTPAAPVSVPADGSQATATVSNTRKLGNLDMTKTVNWDGVTPVTKTFQICISGPSFPSPAKDCKLFTDPGSLAKTWNNLIPGSYSVTETDPGTEWTVSITGSPVTVPVDGGTASASVSNTRKLGSLKVTKSVNWNSITPVSGQTFQICIQGPSYATPDCKTFTYPSTLEQTWANLVPGNYTVTETNPGNMWTVVLPGSPVVVPADGSQATATVSNTRKLGSLKISKSVNWNGVPAIPAQSFQICIQGPSYVTPDCKTFTDPSALDQTWTNLIPGNYTVTETDPGNMWTMVVPGSPITVPVDGSQATAALSNTRKLGNLTITKSVSWSGVTPINGTVFDICITGPAPAVTKTCKAFTYPASLTQTWNNLVPGSYTVSENNPGDEWTINVSGSPAIVPIDGGTVNASVSNTRKLGIIQVTKAVDWLGFTPDPNKTFSICITGPSFPAGNCKTAGHLGGQVAWSGLIPGSYTVTEANPGAEWQVAITGSPANVPVNGGTASATVANARTQNGLLVTKSVNWNGITPNPGQTFQICIQGPSYPSTPNCKTTDFDGGTLIWNSLLAGNYTITETALGPEWQGDITGSPATIPATGGNVSANVMNSRKLGSLQVTKVVNWNGVTPDSSQVFDICIQGPSYSSPNCRSVGQNGGTLVWDRLQPGSYDVSEPNPGNTWNVAYNGTPAVIPISGGTLAATVTNNRKLGGLQISTTVDWNGITPDTSSSFNICIAGPSFTTPNCKTVGYNGGLLSWTSLIPGQYTITHNAGVEWTAVITSTPATVPSNGGTANANVNLQRKRGSLQVTKTVEWLAYTPDPAKTFQICITGPSFPGGDCKTAGYQGGVLTWNNLVPGSYTVNENAPGSEWQVVVIGSPANVPTNGGTSTVSVSNVRKSNGLLVNKVVNWNGVTPDTGKSFEICIQGPSFPVIPSCKLIGYNGGLLTWTSLLPGSYTVTESAPGNEWQVVITGSPSVVPLDGGNGSALVTNTRILGNLQVTKTVDWGSVAPDPSKQFTICIQGPSYPTTPNCQNTGYNGGALTWNQLIPGLYGVSESTPGPEWQTTVVGSPVTVPVNGGTGNASMTNAILGLNIYLPLVVR